MDYAYPNGYENHLKTNLEEDIYAINKLLFNLREKDLIIIGTQSQTIPYTFGNLEFYPLRQLATLLAAEPDAVILCVNLDDDITYIKRTINFIENYLESKVLAINVYPFIKKDSWNLNRKNEKISSAKFQGYIDNMNQFLEIPLFINGQQSKDIYEECLKFFSNST
ncbi:hypothetical protein [Nosocomiicoccus ampullae]|uniref:Uncharacterized protein n=1 Tax=Nosocomiicoccus ampullae TaxID=489910 RepID=A0A9Q2CVU6_9STAP|nr:hypothetical protein [Nosocomiicoccus ampullae]MBB5175191.1 hypothetical protein [Nosocomiicoccus ampullae]QYA46430.1 hypothetical protein KPF49_05350 [Nosocomiicoccus ampullae]